MASDKADALTSCARSAQQKRVKGKDHRLKRSKIISTARAMNSTAQGIYLDGDRDVTSIYPIIVKLRTSLIFTISFLIIASNVINLSVLRSTRQIPSISRYCLINLSSADFLVGCVSCAPCVVSSALDRLSLIHI